MNIKSIGSKIKGNPTIVEGAHHLWHFPFPERYDSVDYPFHLPDCEG